MTDGMSDGISGGDGEGLTLAGCARAIAEGELSPVDLTARLLGRIAAFEPCIGAFATLTADAAMAEAETAAREIAAGRSRGPMHGIPVAYKDIYDTAGVTTAGGSRTQLGRVPQADATTVAALRRAGAVSLGKVVTHEFAHGGPSFDTPWPPARNPWNRAHFTGGSSSGSGAAVAAGFCLAALGTDTGGSIRSPAALSGVAGFKPSYGLVSRRGVIPNSFTFDHCGPLAWTVEDCALVLGAIAGHDPLDPASADRPPVDYAAALGGDLRGLRVGVLRHAWEEDLPSVTPAMVATVEAAADALADLGATVEPARIAPLQNWYDVKIAIAETELLSGHRADLVTRPHDFGTDFLVRTLGAVLFTAQDYVSAQRRRRQLLQGMRAVWERFDLLLLPAAPGAAGRLDAHRPVSFWTTPNLTTPFNVMATPALTLCGGFTDEGLPLGVQLAGRPFEDATVLRAGHRLDGALGTRSRRPVLDPAAVPDVPVPQLPPPVDALDAADRARVRMAVEAAGLPADERILALLAETAPHVLAMRARLQRNYDYAEEPWGLWRP